MRDFCVVNASPLIFLSRGNHLKLLSNFADRVLVPEAVVHEIRRKGPEDVTAKSLNQTDWLELVHAPPVPSTIQEWGLGPGESSVLALALATPGTEAVIDDLQGRKCAACLGVPVRGTLGLVLAAKKSGVIPSARSVLDDLLRGGLYLSGSVIDDALRRVGE